jgi:membrane-associated phospholipid phosphatase
MAPIPETPDIAAHHSIYRPGDASQDIYTLPLEGLLAGGISYLPSVREKPLWPFTNEDAHNVRKPTQVPVLTGSLWVGAIGTLTFTGLTFSSQEFKPFTHLRGIAHAFLLTEIATSTAKVTFQRKRPFYDTQTQPTRDSRFSFFSGHASHAFSFATYGSALVWTYTDTLWLKGLYTLAAYTAASWVAYTRVSGYQHYPSDVIAGACVGTLIAGSLFYRVERVLSLEKQTPNSDTSVWQGPSIWIDPLSGVYFSYNIQIH